MANIMDRSASNNLFSNAILKDSKISHEKIRLDGEEDLVEFAYQPYGIREEMAYFIIDLSSTALLSPYPIEDAVRYYRVQGKNQSHKFPISTILPKVQMSNVLRPGDLPRELKVDRCFRKYAKTDLMKELQKNGVTIDDLHPTEEQYHNISENAFKHFLPISFFDNTNFDEHSPTAWFSLGLSADGEKYNIPAKAYLPLDGSLFKYSWQLVSVMEYDDVRCLWKVMTLWEGEMHEIPKVQFHFLAENPIRFAQRIKTAVELRNKSEHVMYLESVIDSVILTDIKSNRILHQKRIDELMQRMNCTAAKYKWLRNEVYLIFQRLTACYEFQQFVKIMPREFPLFTPNSFKEMLNKSFKPLLIEKERRYVQSFQLKMKKLAYILIKETLSYNRGGVEALQNIVAECQSIENMNVFVVNFAKPLTLQDFLTAQNQSSSNLGTFLTTFWPERISTRITIVLRPLGKGWLDITLNKWPVYKVSKISRLIEQVKMRMEQTIQFLLEDSIYKFINTLTDPCLSFVNLDSSYEWTAGYKDTAFPWQKPIFYMVLNINAGGVYYSTPPGKFEPLLIEVFKKSLDKCNAIRCINAATLTNLCFDPLLYIKTVELIEDLFLEKNELLKKCYTNAVIPLTAYAKLYERYVSFCSIQIHEYMREYAAARKKSSDVRQDIEDHKRAKEELRELLPASITIGPFLINVDIVKQAMIKKHSDLVRLIFEYYVDYLYEVNDVLLDECTKVYNKISERPFTIEHLLEIRDYAQGVPEEVEKIRTDVQILLLEYDLLDNFFYNVSDTQFGMKWQAIAWPHKITQRLALLRDEQKNDIEEFKRQHSSNFTVFEESLESLNDEIQQFTLNFDASKVIEMAVEVKKIWRTISELQKTGDLLLHRQMLFELPRYSLVFLNNIIESFLPYRNLWTSGADIIKLQDTTTGNPMQTIDLDEVWKNIEDLRTTLLHSYREFAEKPEVQAVVTEFRLNLNNFIPMYHCIKWVLSEYWQLVHWQELAARSGMDIKYSINLNFQYLMKKGIMDHLDLVEEISNRARLELDDLRRAAEEEERRREEEALRLLRQRESRKCRRDIL